MALYFEMRKRKELLKKKKNEATFLETEDSSSEKDHENVNHNKSVTGEDSMSAEEEVSKSSPVRQVDSPEQHDDDVDSIDAASDMEHEVAAEKDVGASARASLKGQPIGPTPAVIREFSRFLGTMARDSKLAPLNYVTWHKVPQTKLDNMWN
ncbi:unnamed protein product [Cuscuta europaea]|uniref:Uncharacterized protein n=1 Tax=Cuscuta europaea TaxID=41803 RepID=A0A9P1E527_CUSEU|nr:unnamed protein product [Cuscuta europaea]